MNSTMTPAEARASVPLTARCTYLDVASRAPMGDHVHAALQRYQDTYRSEPLPKTAWLEEVERIRGRVASLIGAAPEEIAFTKSTADGVNQVAAALELGEGDNVVVCPAIEHMNNLYPWLHLRERGLEVRTVDAESGAFPLARAAERIDERTRVVTLSATSFVTGARADLTAVSEAAAATGTVVMVDAVQELGALEMDLPGSGVHMAAAATQKMLLGSYGAGLIYLRREVADRLRPPFLSRMGVRWGGAHESELTSDYELRDGAPRFEVGNPNFAGLFALDGALELLEAVGPATIDAHITRLSDRLLDGLASLDVELVTPRDAHGALAVFRPRDVQAVAARLADAGIVVAVRRGGLRASVHVFNDDTDVDRLLDVLDDTVGRARG